MPTVTDDQVVEIRLRSARGESQTALAAEFGVSKQYVNDIVKMRRRTERRVAFEPVDRS